MEHRREVGLGSKPNAKGHIRQRSQWVTQQHLGMVYALYPHELGWRYPREFAKLRREMHSAQARDPCEVVQADGSLDV